MAEQVADEWAQYRDAPTPAPAAAADEWAQYRDKPPGPSLSDVAQATPQGEPEDLPQAFMDRLKIGSAVQEWAKKIVAQPEGGPDVQAALINAATDNMRQAVGEIDQPPTPRASLFPNPFAMLPQAPVDLAKAALQLGGVPLSAGIELVGRATGIPPDVLNTAMMAIMPARGGLGQFSRLAAPAGELQHQVIGPPPKPADFETGATVLTGKPPALPVRPAAVADAPAAAHENLQTLWTERGIHPAEAVHDAKNDAFLRQDLVTPDRAPPDKSGIPPVQSSPVVQGTPRAEVARTGEAHIDEVLDSAPTQQVINNPVIDREHTTPYTAGGSVPLEDPTVFIDYRFPHTMTVDGVTFDPADPFVIHENVEQHVMELLIKGGMTPAEAYPVAHFEFAEKAEGAWYAAHGIDKERAEAAYAPIMAQIQHEPGARPVAPNLYKRTYPHDNPSAALKEPIAEARPSEEEIARAKEILASRPDQAVLEGAAPIEAGEQPAAKSGEAPGGPERPTSAGADVTRPENLPSLKAQPAPRPGSLAASGRAAVDQLVGLGRNIQYMLDPMATGSKRAMVIAKDAMNSVRRIRWEHARIQADLVSSPELKAIRDRLGETVGEQFERMWNAADEESVLRQEIGIKPGGNLAAMQEHMGLATLEPEERAWVERFHANAQAAWLHAVDVGMVEGEGLPAYTPRMVLNVAAGAEHLGPQALNELGRNVFTRTAQMKHRAYMTAEETEEAAKRAVGERMAKQGASAAEIEEAISKVEIARNVRALPLATAKLEEAAVWREMINKIEDAGKAAGEATVSTESRKGWFTIAGNPAFTKWEPAYEVSPTTGKVVARTDDAGRVLMVPKPLFVAPDFAGPLKAILDEGSGLIKLDPQAPSAYGALMTIKGKAMTAILNSPLTHGAVVWSKVAEAAGGREALGFNLYFRGNRIVNQWQNGRAGELIERGLNPIGPRGDIQDINAIMEKPDLLAGHHVSWTGKITSFIPDLFDAAKGEAVERAIAKAGDVMHNDLLWNRVRDAQFGLADFVSDHLVGKGVDRLTADRFAAHFSNMVVGSIPKEAMSAGARAIANIFLFSRSFTLGNAAVYKMAVFGVPKPILAQIERDLGITLPEGATQEAISAAQAQISQTTQSLARRKAISTIALSVGMYYVTNAILQHAMNILHSSASWLGSLDGELRGYARRFSDLMSDVKKAPYELANPLGWPGMIAHLSPTYDNEPTKQDRVHIGYDKDGTAVYARNPLGKYGEEVIGFPTMPATMALRKLSPLASGVLDIFENDKYTGALDKKVPIYDKNDKTIGGDARIAFAAAKHLVMKHLPEGQITGAVDLLRGDGDWKVNAAKAFGPIVGLTSSEGAPGGMARGEQLAAQGAFQMRFDLAWPDIKKQIQRGDIAGAQQALTAIGTPFPMMKPLIRNALNPAAALHGRTLRNFYQSATPEQVDRLQRDLINR